MIKKTLFFMLLCVLFMLQISPLLPFADDGIRPDIILILTIFLGVQLPLCSGAWAVFTLSCLMEAFSGVNNGLYPLIYMCVFMGIRSLERFFDFSTSLNLFLLTAFSLIVKFIILLFCFNFIYEYKHFALQELFLKESGYTLLVLPAVFSLLSPLYKMQKDTFAIHDFIAEHEHRHS
jgi:cell shape-determining protein MreD